MVNINIIQEIFNQVIEDNVTNKCKRNSDIHEELAGISDTEKRDRLEEYLNPAEMEDYRKQKARLENNKEEIKFLDSDSWLYHHTLEEIEKQEGIIFDYEKRLLDGSKPLSEIEIPDYDINDFHRDHVGSDRDTIRKLEQKQIDLQGEVEFSRNNLSGLRHYFMGDYRTINGYLYKTSDYTELSEPAREQSKTDAERWIKQIDGAMEKSKGLTQNTIMFRYGHWDFHIQPGEKVKLDGYTSLSYNKNISDSHHFDKPNRWKMRVLVKKGTKGIVANDTHQGDLTKERWRYEHEYLLPRGMEATCLGYDVENHEVLILIE